jgi:hypothetical protein
MLCSINIFKKLRPHIERTSECADAKIATVCPIEYQGICIVRISPVAKTVSDVVISEILIAKKKFESSK